MNILRAGIPAAIGAILLYVGVQQNITAIRYTQVADILGEVRGGILPIGIGLALVVVSVAMAGRLRLGYLLGLCAAGAMALAGLAGIAVVLPTVNECGEFGCLSMGFGVIAGLWVIGWIGYGFSVRRAHSVFSPQWQGKDRWVAAALGTVVVASGVLLLTVGAFESQAAAQSRIDDGQADELAAATTVDVHVVDASVDTASPSVVEHLTLDVAIRSTISYQLQAPPVLCLTDLATYRDGGKAGVLCWGADDPGTDLGAGLPNLTVSPIAAAYRVELSRTRSMCEYSVGMWSAALALTPVPGQGIRWIQTSFTVTGDSPGPAQSACTGL